jgi:hypothetical protein
VTCRRQPRNRELCVCGRGAAGEGDGRERRRRSRVGGGGNRHGSDAGLARAAWPRRSARHWPAGLVDEPPGRPERRDRNGLRERRSRRPPACLRPAFLRRRSPCARRQDVEVAVVVDVREPARRSDPGAPRGCAGAAARHR